MFKRSTSDKIEFPKKYIKRAFYTKYNEHNITKIIHLFFNNNANQLLSTQYYASTFM